MGKSWIQNVLKISKVFGKFNIFKSLRVTVDMESMLEDHVYTMEFTIRRTNGNLTHFSPMIHLIPLKTSEHRRFFLMFSVESKGNIREMGQNGLFEIGSRGFFSYLIASRTILSH